MALTPRLRRQVDRDFPSSGDEIERLLSEAESGNQSHERVLAAIVFVARGDVERLRSAIELSQRDWRDVLVAGGLANGDWPEVLDERLGATHT